MMTADQFIKNIKKGNAVSTRHDTAIQGYAKMIEELLNAIEPVLAEALIVAEGDSNILYPQEQGLLTVYASWDHYNKGRRKTSEELIEAARPKEDNDGDDIPDA